LSRPTGCVQVTVANLSSANMRADAQRPEHPPGPKRARRPKHARRREHARRTKHAPRPTP